MRLGDDVIDGIIDNSRDGVVTGHVRVARAASDDDDFNVTAMKPLKVMFQLSGDLPSKYSGIVVCITNPGPCADSPWMDDLALVGMHAGQLDAKMEVGFLAFDWTSAEVDPVTVDLPYEWLRSIAALN